MADYKRIMQRFLCLGVQLTRPVDRLDPGKFPILHNIRAYIQGIIQARPGLLALGNPIAGIPTVHSVRRLNDPATSTFTRVVGAGTGLYAGQTNFPSTVTDLSGGAGIGTGFSGKPLSMIPFRPNKSPQAWMYVADGNKLVKVRVDGKAANTGIAPPLLPPVIKLGVPRYQVIEDFRTTPLTWDTCGVPAPPALTQVKRVDDGAVVITQIVYDSGTSGWATVSMTQVGMTAIGPGALIDILGANPENNVKVFSVQRTPINAGASCVIADVVYDSTGSSAGTGPCTIVPTVPITDIAVDAMVIIGGTEAVRVESINVGDDGAICFRCTTVNNHTAPESLIGVVSFRAYFALTHAVNDPVRSWAYQTLTPTPGTHGSWLTLSNPPPDPPRNNCGNATAGLLTLDLTSVPGSPRRQIQPGDKIHLSILVSDVPAIMDGIIYFDVDSGTNDFAHNLYTFNFGPADLVPVGADTPTVPTNLTTAQQRDLATSFQLPPASTDLSPGAFEGESNVQPILAQTATGASQWTELVFTVGQLTRIGVDQSRGLANVRRIGILFGYTAVESLAISSWWIGGTYGPDAGGGDGYAYRFRARSQDTGAQSLPGPPTRFKLFPSRDDILITPSYVNDPQVDSTQQGVLAIERFGGSLDSWREIGTVPNASGGPATFDDKFPDSTVVADDPGNETNFQPFPIIDLPRQGVCNTIGSKLFWISGDFFDMRLAPGTQIEVNGIFYTMYSSPVTLAHSFPDGDFAEIVQNAGNQVNVPFSIPQGILQGQPLPVIFGPIQQTGEMFGCGDPKNPGTLYWTNGQDPDSADDANSLELTGPSEPLMNGCMYGESRPVVFSGEQIFALFPQEGGYRTQLVTNKVGLLARYALAAGPKIWFRGKNGIYETALDEPQSITDADLYPLFPHDGIPGQAVNGYSPVDDTALDAQRLSYDRGLVRFTYQDVCGITQHLVYDTKVKGWFPDNYPNPTPAMFYDEEGEGINSLLAGCNFGLLCQVRDGSDNGNQIACHVRTPSLDDNDPASKKQFQDAMLDIDPDGVTVNVEQGFNQHTTTLAVQTVAGSGRVRQEFVDNAAAGTKAYNASLDITWEVTDCPAPPDCPCIGGIPEITSLVPSTAVAGDPGFTLTVNGLNFRPDSVVRWDGVDLVTTYVTGIQLTAVVPAGDIVTDGTFPVTVFNPPPGCGESAPSDFVVTAAPAAGAIIGGSMEDGTSQIATFRPSMVFPKFPADNVDSVLAAAGTIRNFHFYVAGFGVDDGIDVGQSFTATVYVNGVATSLSVTAVGPTPTILYADTNPAHAVVVNAGDRIRVEYTETGFLNSRGWSLEYVNADGAAMLGIGWGQGFTQTGIGTAKIAYSIITGTNVNEAAGEYHKIEVAAPRPGTIKNLYVRTYGVPADDVTINLRVNGVDKALSVTIPGGSGAGNFSDTVNTVAVNQGDLLCWIAIAASGVFDQIANIMAEFVLDDGGSVLAAVPGLQRAIGFSWTPPFAQDTYYTEGENKWPSPRDGTLKNFFVNMSAGLPGPLNGACDFTVAVNGVDTAITVNIGAGASGVFSDTTHTVAVAQGDLITVHITTATNTSKMGGTYSLELL